jgi:serine-type D-Ala-D-Ala carboxypeptidase/endopeptidase (penicillin-binding protein 4)
MSKMPRSQENSLRIHPILKISALAISISLGMWNPPAIAQSLTAAPLNFSPPTARRFCRSHLETAIDAIIRSPRFKNARWGVLIKPIEIPTVLYQHNPDVALIPASNVKLLTTAAALKIASASHFQSSASLESWIIEVNRYSDNAKADALRRRIGGQPAIINALGLLGVNAQSYAQVDGSGLSRSNRATPSALVAILESMFTDDHSGLFYQSLAIAGVNGTLQNRFRNTPLQGNLHGKTGTLQGVRALSGYLDNPNYGTIAFSIVVNQPGQSGQTLAQAIDQIALRAAQVERCE